jgi:flagellar secretion chaperone FliS
MDARSLYRESAVRGASPVGFVILLYEQMIEDLRRAVDALDHKQIEPRTRYLNHAVVVIGHLQRTLDMEQGGKVAQNLALFYDVLRQALTQAHARASKELLATQISNLLNLRDAWIEVDRQETGSGATAGSEAVAAPSPAERRRWES